MKIARVLLTVGLAAGAFHGAHAGVLYSFQQTSLTPSPAAFGSIGFQLQDSILITDAELTAGVVARPGNGMTLPSYNLTIGMDGSLSGTILGVLDAYDYALVGTNGMFSGQLTYGDSLIPECASPGCTITGSYTTIVEPGSVGVFGLALLGVAATRRRERPPVTA